jgi:hypothetical protein
MDIGSVIGDAFGRAILKAPAPKPAHKTTTLAIWLEAPAILAVVLAAVSALAVVL